MPDFVTNIGGDTQNTDPFSFGGNPTADFFNYAYQERVAAAEIPVAGTKSLFNEYSVFYYSLAANDTSALYDWGTDIVQSEISRNPTFANIIDWAKNSGTGSLNMGPTPYAWADFLYCKHADLIPNNYMITLRRYAIPMLDNLKALNNKRIPPIAQAVTWMGGDTGNELNEIMKMTWGIKWKLVEASVQEVTGNEKGFESSPLGVALGGNIIAGVEGFLNPNDYSGLPQAQSDYAKAAWGSEGPYANKVYGPVNVINNTMARDRGLDFEQEIKIKFSYSLRSIGSINPKMAMLDIISNMLALTYNNAKFWGGAIRYFPQFPQVKFFGDQEAFYAGQVDEYIDSLIAPKNDDGTGGGAFTNLGSSLMQGLTKLLQDPLGALREFAQGAGKFTMAKIAARDRPAIIAMRSLLTGLPVGEWHLVVGNPMNPIMCIGNLICKKVDLEFSNDLGPDDFPTEMYFTVTLEHGKPRDAGDIQSMFNNGNGRMYFGINDSQTFSSASNTNISGTNTDPAQYAEIMQNAGNLTPSGSNKTMYGFTTEEMAISKQWAGAAPSTYSPPKE